MTSFTVFFLAFLACSSLVNSRKEDSIGECERSIIEKTLFYENWLIDGENAVKNLFGNFTELIHKERLLALKKISKGLPLDTKNAGKSRVQSDCMAKYMSDIYVVFIKAKETLRACIEEARDETENITHNLLSALRSVREEFVTTIADIRGCNDELCAPENACWLHRFFKTFQGRISEVDDEVDRFMQETSPEIFECPNTAYNNFLVEMKKTNDNFIACNKG